MRRFREFGVRLKKLQKANPTEEYTIILTGVLIRWRDSFVFRKPDGTYCCGGVGVNGGYAAILVPTAVPEAP
jgi:hypothetical protein